MGERDPAEAMEVLDRLLKFFGGGERRVKGRLSARGSVRLSVAYVTGSPIRSALAQPQAKPAQSTDTRL